MKLKISKKLILSIIAAALLLSIPVQSGAVTKYNFTCGTQKVNCSGTILVKFDKGCYTIIKNQNQPYSNYYTTIGKQNQIISNFYVTSLGSYLRPSSQPQPVIRPQPTPKPESQPTPQPEPQPEPNPQQTPKPEPQPEPNPQQTPEPEPQPEPNPQQTPEPEPQPTPEPKPDTGSDTGGTSNGQHSLSAEEIQMVDYVNKARQDAGLQPLQIDSGLSNVAALKSRDMYDNNYFSHDSPTYGSPFDMMTKFGIKYSGAAENIAKNSSVAAAHNAFMNSQGHRDNILNPIYTHIGVGIYKGYYTQMFIRK